LSSSASLHREIRGGRVDQPSMRCSEAATCSAIDLNQALGEQWFQIENLPEEIQ